MRVAKLVVAAGVFTSGIAVGALSQSASDDMSLAGAVWKSRTSGTTIRMLLDETNLGGTEIEIGEITFAPGTNSGDHPHGSTEIFYVLSGELVHVVNGERHVLSPGMLGFVRPPDVVNHIVPGDEPVRALVIWAPGGEAARVLETWEKQP